ncbi:MAG: hypothetical protein Q8P05_00085 [Candidatus Diapherotrites archaeon]|nr:hypothetical protein [Candidatus Diapherotrites archaeon]MDZ4256962.1 hypothetical protein [archaeon]
MRYWIKGGLLGGWIILLAMGMASAAGAGGMEDERDGGILPIQEEDVFFYPPETTPALTILNPQENPIIHRIWEVRLKVEGKADLRIAPAGETKWFDGLRGDLTMEGVYCGDEKLEEKWEGDEWVIPNFECDETIYERSRVESWGKHQLEFSFGEVKEYAYNQTADFHIQRGEAVIPVNVGTVTITADVNYDAPADINKAFIRHTATRLTASGNQIGQTTQNPAYLFTYVSNPQNLLSAITFAREQSSGTLNTTITWEIIEYVGPPGGDNEFIVRDSSVATAASGNLTGEAVGVVADDNKVAIFITGQSADQTANGTGDRALFTSAWTDSTNTPTFTRGDTTGTAHVSYAVVEFIGQHWANVRRVTHTYSAAGSEETETFSPTVGDINKTFIESQLRTSNGGLDELGQLAYLKDTSTLSFQLKSGANVAHDAVVWIIENTQGDGNKMSVQRRGGSRGTGQSEPDTWTETIDTVFDLNQSSVFGETSTSTGTGFALPRGHINLRLTATNTITLWRSDTGQSIEYRYEVIEWPTATIPQAKDTATTLFIFNVVSTSGHTITYGGNCTASAFFFNEHDAVFDPDADGNAAKIKPRPIRFDFQTFTQDQNFDGVSEPSSTHVGYKSNVTEKPPFTNDTPSVEFTTTNYSNISADDTSYWTQSETTTTVYPAMRAVFRPTFTDVQRIVDINVMFVGNSGTGPLGSICGTSTYNPADLNIFIWNYTRNLYETIASLPGTGDGSPGGRSISGNTSNYIPQYVSTDGNITLLVTGVPASTDTGNKQSCMTIDYLDLNLTYYPTSTNFCQSETLSPFTITNVGGSSVDLDGNFSSAFTGTDLNIVLKVWQGTGSGCGSDDNGLGGWEKDCSVTGTTTPPTATTCRQYNQSNAITPARLVTGLGGGDTNQLCFSGDMNIFVNAGDHNKNFETRN